MAEIGLRGIVDKTFVERFSALASSGSSSGSGLAQALRGGGSRVSISDGLRMGARIYATAVQNLNSTISIVNLSQDTLQKLGEITDRLITVTEQATKSSTGEQGRRSLNTRFTALANDFQEIVDNANLGDKEYLTKEGLQELFTLVGLTPEDSSTLSSIFDKFLLSAKDDVFASEYIKGQRPVPIPAGAYSRNLSDSEYKITKVTSSGITDANISTVSNAFSDTDTVLNQNPSYTSLLSAGIDGTVTGLEAGALSANVTLKATDEASGYSVMESTDNFLGFNSGGYKQLYLVNATGTVVHQFTNNASSSLTYGEVDLTSDLTRVAYSTKDGTTNTLRLATATTLGEDPSTSTHATVETTVSASTIYSQAKISDDGNYIAYFKDSGGNKVIFRDTATLTADTFLSLETNNVSFGFIDSDQLAIGNSSTLSVQKYSYDDMAYSGTILTSTSSPTILDTLEVAGGNGYVATVDTSARSILLYNEAGTAITSYAYDAGDSISNISLAFKSDGNVDIGILGSLPSINADSAVQLYRLSENPAAGTRPPLARDSTEAQTLFSSSRNIATRGEAFRMLTDLKALKNQITENIEMLDKATALIAKNIDLVRATGLAFLELSDQIGSDAKAEDVARDLRTRIRRNAPAALSQAQNLEAITVAALAISSDE